MMDKTQDYYDREYLGELLKGRFPRPGAKLRFVRIDNYHATNIIANAQRELHIGEVYTLKMIRLASSWACITLEETGDTEFALGFFDTLESTAAVPPSKF